MTNIEKIKDMMSNELWMEAIDSVTELVIAAANAQKEVDALKEQNEAIINERDELLKSLDVLYKNYQSALSDKVALIKECDRLTNIVHEQGSEIINLRAKNYDLKAKIKEPVGMVAINPCRDLEEAYSPDSNTIIKVKNLYITNNYFSEEDKDSD